ncbi:leucine-rich repeat and fibronectin type-III domain-containing protein 5-like [Stegodyphus dumicola]|uniref:leucine-rich repeat and fibronectin type-III domain-containing protein 5-like n=1 Tax=Stegodyphus dumicola TaxID=202533 RepID=UPI0015A8E2C2|nr:leucine-rich repeat and fibronectin type-III domain-containing protein 5-like [Stegodyphus dumicola]
MKFISLILSGVLFLVSCCPPEESLYPCVCLTYESESTVDIVCDDLDNEHDLQNAAAACKKMPNMHTFMIVNSVLNYIPHSTFEGTLFKSIEVKGTTMISLSDTDEAFVGLENTLDSLAIVKSTIGLWNWSKLKDLTRMTHLEARDVGLQSIENDINYLRFLRSVDFSKNEISWICDHAFENFSSLTHFVIPENEIKKLKRSMFPNHAYILRFINLRKNQIQTLPRDIFENMPKLTTLLIGENHILTLDEKTFSPIWDNLRYLEVGGNDLRCDCRMTWIITRRLRGSILGYCAEPPELKGTNLTKLNEKDLWC